MRSQSRNKRDDVRHEKRRKARSRHCQTRILCNTHVAHFLGNFLALSIAIEPQNQLRTRLRLFTQRFRNVYHILQRKKIQISQLNATFYTWRRATTNVEEMARKQTQHAERCMKQLNDTYRRDVCNQVGRKQTFRICRSPVRVVRRCKVRSHQMAGDRRHTHLNGLTIELKTKFKYFVIFRMTSTLCARKWSARGARQRPSQKTDNRAKESSEKWSRTVDICPLDRILAISFAADGFSATLSTRIGSGLTAKARDKEKRFVVVRHENRYTLQSIENKRTKMRLCVRSDLWWTWCGRKKTAKRDKNNYRDKHIYKFHLEVFRK